MILNAILCVAVTVMVVSPLVWAILTQHHDQPNMHTSAATARASTEATRRTRPRHYQPVSAAR